MTSCFHPRIDGGVGAHRAGDLAHGHLLRGPFQPLEPPPHFEGPQPQHHAERDGFGVHSVAAPDHHGVAMLQRPPLQHPAECPGLIGEQGSRPLQLQGQAGVEHVGRGHPEVDVLARVPHVLGHVGEERDHVVLGGLLDLPHPGGVEGRLRLDLGHRVGGHLSQFDPGFAHGDLHLEPGGHLGLLGPQGGHLGGAVAVDHLRLLARPGATAVTPSARCRAPRARRSASTDAASSRPGWRRCGRR